MEFDSLLSRLALALGIGLVFGLERGWQRREAEAGARAAGIRTFAISGLLGGVIAALALAAGGPETAGGGILLAAGFATFAAVISLFGRDENKISGSSSATTVIAAMLTFALGAYGTLGDVRIAAAAAVAAVSLLALRQEIHGWVAKVTWPELRSVLVLLAMTFIALPIMPDQPIGPFGGVNPREVWLIAVILAAVSFLAYVCVKYLDARRGLLIAAAAGAVVSSTAVTMTNARHAAAKDAPPGLLAAGVALASAVMFMRALAIVAVLKFELIALIGPAICAGAIFAAGFGIISAYGLRPDSQERQKVKFRNPFEFLPVVGFALFLGLIILLGRMIGESFGASATIIGSAVVGLVDVDSVTVSVVRLAPQTLSYAHAAYAIVAAIAANTLSKVAIGAAIGHGRFAANITAMAFGSLMVGGAALWLTFAIVAP